MTRNLRTEKNKKIQKIDNDVSKVGQRQTILFGKKENIAPGKLYRYTIKLLMKKVTTINIRGSGYVSGSYVSLVKAQLYPEFNEIGQPNAVTKTYYTIDATQLEKNYPKGPYENFNFGTKLEEKKIKFALWNPFPKEEKEVKNYYTLGVKGKAKFQKEGSPDFQEFDVLTGVNLYLKKITPKLITSEEKPNPFYDSGKMQPNGNSLALNKEMSLTYSFSNMQNEIAVYSFMQTLKKGSFFSVKSVVKDEKREEFNVDLSDSLDIVPVMNSGIQVKALALSTFQQAPMEGQNLIPFTDNPRAFCYPYFYNGPKEKEYPCVSVDYKAMASIIEYKVDFLTYLMRKEGTLDDEDSFWVPVERAIWSINLKAACSEADDYGVSCGTGIGRDGIDFSSDWSLDKGSTFGDPKDSNWHLSPDLPKWSNFFQKAVGELVTQDMDTDEGKPYYFLCKTRYPLPGAASSFLEEEPLFFEGIDSTTTI